MTQKHAELRVLVADDSEEVARRIERELKALDGIEVIGPASDGIQALALFERTAPDVALLDFAMPGMTGLQVLRAIRASGKPCLVILLTAHTDHAIEIECMLAGADHFFVKHGDFDRVIDLLARRLASRGV